MNYFHSLKYLRDVIIDTLFSGRDYNSRWFFGLPMSNFSWLRTKFLNLLWWSIRCLNCQPLNLRYSKTLISLIFRILFHQSLFLEGPQSWWLNKSVSIVFYHGSSLSWLSYLSSYIFQLLFFVNSYHSQIFLAFRGLFR